MIKGGLSPNANAATFLAANFVAGRWGKAVGADFTPTAHFFFG